MDKKKQKEIAQLFQELMTTIGEYNRAINECAALNDHVHGTNWGSPNYRKGDKTDD